MNRWFHLEFETDLISAARYIENSLNRPFQFCIPERPAMSRSRKKTSAAGIAIAPTEKQDKRCANHKLRRKVRSCPPKMDLLPILREVSGPWSMAKDGRFYFDAKRFPKLMRK